MKDVVYFLNFGQIWIRNLESFKPNSRSNQKEQILSPILILNTYKEFNKVYLYHIM